MDEIETCRTCGCCEVEISRDERGLIEQLDGTGNVICDLCWADDQQASSEITADLLWCVDRYIDGALVEINGGYLARSLIRRADEPAEHLDWVRGQVVAHRATMWDGHDLEGLSGEERYEMLAAHLTQTQHG